MYKVLWSHRLVATSLAVSVLLVAGIALSGWYVGSRGTTNRSASPTVSGSTWVGPEGLTHTRSSDVDSLRAEGWTLPLVGLTGYSTTALRQTSVAGQAAVVVDVDYNLSRSREITIVEQRGHVDPEHPLDGATGLPATAVGLKPTSLAGSTVWIREGKPWRAMIVHEDVVYTLVSDVTPPRMVRVLQQVEASHRAVLEQPEESPRGTMETIAVGWQRILGLQ